MSIQLPAEAESVRCSDFARANRIDPGGTALAPDVIVVVEVPEPWPKPAGKHPGLIELVRFAAEAPETIRLLAGVPANHDCPRAIAFRPADGGMTRSEVQLGEDPVSALRIALLGQDSVSVAVGGQATVLVCTQGSHDVCCGTDGEVLARALDAHADLEVIRVSHTGGHRFAPTAMTLPDGRMWAYIDESFVRGVVDRTLDPIEAASQCRGWWGLPTGPAQIAERAAFSALGWDVDGLPRSAEVADLEGGGGDVRLDVGDSAWQIAVHPGREVPTIACEAPGGLPVKPGREWSVGRIERVDAD